MSKALVVVESPAKAKTIKKYLGSGYSVIASVGHVIDLPKKEIGVDVDANFTPKYVTIHGKNKVLKRITDEAKTCDAVYLAPDPDREGEAIAWHIAQKIKRAAKSNPPTIYRARFNEITKSAIKKSINNPDELNQSLFEAQQARRVLDRLVGYRLSPLLWDKVRRGLSAGRVQSVAVRIVCEREQEIEAFNSQEYWSIVSKLQGSKTPDFEAKLIKIDGKKVEISTEDNAAAIVSELKTCEFNLAKITKRERKRNPTPPFITSKLQQEAARKLGYTAKKTMALAQMLYEGIEIGVDGSVGLITYMRTDSTRISGEALGQVRDYILEKYGKDMLPDKPVQYKSKNSAQDAHEAIRPTSVNYPPEKVKAFLERDAYRLYELIWRRFVASQMKPAIFDQTSFDVHAGKYILRATGQVMRFPGFISVYLESIDDKKEKGEDENNLLPDLSEGELLALLNIDANQHFTQPPPRFTEASLVKELEERGIGRPSTYASIMSTIQDKGYASKDQKRFFPSDLGKLVNTLLTESFPKILDIGFTAQMETKLDDIEAGKLTWTTVLSEFYGPFDKAVIDAKQSMRNVKGEQVETDIKCEKCDNMMVIKWGRHGEFLACSAYPECKSTKEFAKKADGQIEVKEDTMIDENCDKCGKSMVLKMGRFGEFLACSGYPDCRNTKSIGTGVHCPKCESGALVQKSTRRGRIFYACDKYPDCEFAVWDKPINEKCPKCDYAFLLEKYAKRGTDDNFVCGNSECDYKRKMES